MLFYNARPMHKLTPSLTAPIPPTAAVPPADPQADTAQVSAAASAPDAVFRRGIRSFVKRAGRITPAQERATAELGPRYILPDGAGVLDLTALFADSDTPQSPAPVVLEIGFGMGEATAAIAQALPQTHFLCCEVHEPGVGALLKRIAEQDLRNIRIHAGDAVALLQQRIAPQSLDGVHIFFPDPWHKARHHKRRLIQPPLVALLAQRLKPGGYVHCATDWQPYAEQMLAVLEAEPLLHNPARLRHPELEGYAPRPDYRPLTKFERRGLRLGHGVWDLVLRRC
ncbi:MAG: tRNA (guanosine(46)-N7)-methyltransferase TrmB [Rhodoferax sp.]